MKLTIQNQSSMRVPKAFLEDVVRSVSRHLKAKHKLNSSDELTIVFLNSAPARKLNKKFRGRDYATDILSFEPMGEGSFGEFVMCPQVLAQQAEEHGWSFKFECALMIIHGILHLLGYDHVKSKKEATKMYAIQSQLVEKILKTKLQW